MSETERQAEMELIEFLKFTEQDDSEKYEMLKESACEIRALENKNQQLEDVIEEVRKCIDNMIVYGDDDGDWYFKEVHEEHYEKLLQILDKAKEN